MEIHTEEMLFRFYLTNKGYKADSITITKTGSEMIISSKVPSLSDFTQVKRIDFETYWARLSKTDYQNERITNNLY
jgi:hypothetical protein